MVNSHMERCNILLAPFKMYLLSFNFHHNHTKKPDLLAINLNLDNLCTRC